MKIWVARIPEEGSRYEGSDPAEILQMEGDPFVGEVEDVSYDLYAQRVSGELVVRGALSSSLAMRCSRCSEFFWTTVGVSDFLRAYPAPEGTDSVDVTEDLREEILLHMPRFAVCSEECKGVCPRCGTNLNKGSCTCEASKGPDPWSALDGLNLE